MPNEDDAKLRVLQGTFDLMILRTLETMSPQHAYGIATRLEQPGICRRPDHTCREICRCF